MLGADARIFIGLLVADFDLPLPFEERNQIDLAFFISLQGERLRFAVSLHPFCVFGDEGIGSSADERARERFAIVKDLQRKECIGFCLIRVGEWHDFQHEANWLADDGDIHRRVINDEQRFAEALRLLTDFRVGHFLQVFLDEILVFF